MRVYELYITEDLCYYSHIEKLFEKELLLMGGNAFKQVDVRRIERKDIQSTLRFVAQHIGSTGMAYDYMMANLMGSANKQNDSGDLDVAVDEDSFSLKTLREINDIMRATFGDLYVSSATLKGGQIQTAWPIAGNPKNGYCQVDFILGNLEWLKFSHWSPGKDKSPYKGVVISTLLGILSKFRKDFEIEDNDGNRVARVGLQYNLEKGLYRSWQIQKKIGQGVSKVTGDEWETGIGKLIDKGIILDQKIPRFARLGYVKEPEAVVEMLFGDSVKPKDIDTFEKAWKMAIRKYPNRIDELKSRLVYSLARSGLKYDMDEKEIEAMISSLPTS